MFHNVDSGQVGCGRSPKHFEGMSPSLSFSQWRQKSIKCLGAFYYFSDFKVAYSLVKVETVVFCILCVSLPWPWRSGSWLICWKAGPSLPTASGRCLPGVLYRAGLSRLTRLLMFGFCVLGSLEALILPSFPEVVACGWEVGWITFCSFQWCGVFWWNSISGKTCFIQF